MSGQLDYLSNDNKMIEFEKLVKNQLKLKKKAETESVESEIGKNQDPRIDRLEKYLRTLPTGEEYRETLREISGLRDFCTSQCSTIVSLNVKIEDLSRDNSKMTTEIKDLVKSNEILRATLKEAQNKPSKDVNYQAQQESVRLKTENEKLRKQVERLRAGLKSKENESNLKMEELQSRLKAGDDVVEELKNNLCEVTDEGESLKKTVKEMAAKQGDLMDENCFLTEQLRKFQISATRRIHEEDRETIMRIDTCFQQLKSTVAFYSKFLQKSENMGESEGEGSLGEKATEMGDSSSGGEELQRLEGEIHQIKQKASLITAKQICDKLDCNVQ